MYLEGKYGEGNVYKCYITDYNREDPRLYHVVKCHEYVADAADAASLIVLSERDYEGMAASMSKFHDLEYTAADMVKLCEYYSEYYRNRDKVITFSYSDIMYNSGYHAVGKIWCLRRLIKAMESSFGSTIKEPISPSEVSQLVERIEKLPMPEGTPDYADPITLLHPKHKR